MFLTFRNMLQAHNSIERREVAVVTKLLFEGSVSNIFNAVIGYLFSFVAIYLIFMLLNFTRLVMCLLLNLISLYLWASFHVILRSAGPCVTLGDTALLYSVEI
jgi:hypothetical protein